MLVLSALLPGVREFRTPFVTGILWAASLALLFGPSLVTNPSSERFAERLEPLGVPSSAYLAAAGLVVYLLGSLLVVRESPLAPFLPWLKRVFGPMRDSPSAMFPPMEDARFYRVRWAGWWLQNRRWWLRLWSWVGHDDRRETEVGAWVGDRFDVFVGRGLVPVMHRFGRPHDALYGFDNFYTTASVQEMLMPLEGQDDDEAQWEGYRDNWQDLRESYIDAVLEERQQIETRLQLKFPEVYAEIDRLKVEGEFRLSILWPAILLILVLSAYWTPLVLGALIVPPLLAVAGARRIREARDKTWAVVIAGEVTAPIQDAMAKAEEEDEPRTDFDVRFAGGSSDS